MATGHPANRCSVVNCPPPDLPAGCIHAEGSVLIPQSSSHMRAGRIRNLACNFHAKRLTAYMFVSVLICTGQSRCPIQMQASEGTCRACLINKALPQSMQAMVMR